MTEAVSVRDLRNRGGEVLSRVEHGLHLLVTRDGHPVAELRPVQRAGTPTAELLARWRRLPVLDSAALRADIDAIVDASL